MRFYIIDAFSSAAFGGDPAGIIFIEQGDDFPSDESMLKTAAELEYSETAFVKRLDENTFHLRYFTPEKETDMCGHATIAAYTALIHENTITDGTYINISRAGKMEICVDEEFINIKMPIPNDLFSNSPNAMDSFYKNMGIKYEKVVTEKTDMLFDGIMPKLISAAVPEITLPVLEETALFAMAPNLHISSWDIDNINICESQPPHQEYRTAKILGKTQIYDGAMSVQVGGAGIILAEGNIFIS